MSAISLGHSTAFSSVVAATTHTTGTFTPTAAGNFLLISIEHTTSGANTTDITSVTGACLSGGSAQRVTSLQCGTGALNHRLEVWAAVTSASASTIVFTYPATRTGAVWTIQEFTNVDLSRGYLGLIGGITANVASGSGVGGTGTISMLKSQSATNMVLSIWALGSNDTVTARAGWTEITDQGSSGAPFGRVETQYSFGTTEVQASASFTSQAYAGAVVELWGIDGSGLWSAVETFTKTDGTQWGNDQNWDTVDGSPTTVSNQAATSAVATYADSNFSNDSSSGNMEGKVSAATMALSGNSVIGVRLRADPTDNSAYEFIRVGAATLAGFTILLRKRIGPNYTTIAGPTPLPRTAVGTAELLRMTANGSTLTCYVDGVQVLAATDTSLGTNRLRGGLVLRSNIANDTLADNFTLSDIGVLVGTSVGLASAIDLGRNSAKATSNWRKRIAAKVPQSARSFGNRVVRVARMQGRSGQTTGARGVFFLVDFQEGFRVLRPIIAKGRTSASTKAVLDTQGKGFRAKVSLTSAGGGVFHPAVLDVSHGLQHVNLSTASSAKAPVRRGVGYTAKTLSANGAVARLSGGRLSFNATISIAVSSLTAQMSGGRTTLAVNLPTAVNTVVDLTKTSFQLYFLCPVDPNEDPPIYPYPHIGNRLFKYYRARPAGINVFIYSDNTVSTVEPDGYSTLWQESDRTSDTLVGAPHVLHAFWGGHEASPITDDEQHILVAAGYPVQSHP